MWGRWVSVPEVWSNLTPPSILTIFVIRVSGGNDRGFLGSCPPWGCACPRKDLCRLWNSPVTLQMAGGPQEEPLSFMKPWQSRGFGNRSLWGGIPLCISGTIWRRPLGGGMCPSVQCEVCGEGGWGRTCRTLPLPWVDPELGSPELRQFGGDSLRKKNSPGWCGPVDWVLACKPKVAGSIPHQGTCLGCGPGPQLGAHERQPHIDVSLPLFLPPFPAL